MAGLRPPAGTRMSLSKFIQSDSLAIMQSLAGMLLLVSGLPRVSRQDLTTLVIHPSSSCLRLDAGKLVRPMKVICSSVAYTSFSLTLGGWLECDDNSRPLAKRSRPLHRNANYIFTRSQCYTPTQAEPGIVGGRL